MDRRLFLRGVITSAAAGAVSLATDDEVAAFVAPGDHVAVSQAPLEVRRVLRSVVSVDIIGRPVYVETADGALQPLGIITEAHIEGVRLDDEGRPRLQRADYRVVSIGDHGGDSWTFHRGLTDWPELRTAQK